MIWSKSLTWWAASVYVCVTCKSKRKKTKKKKRRRRKKKKKGKRRERERSDTMRGKEGRLVSVRNAASEREVKECVPQCKSCPLRPEIFLKQMTTRDGDRIRTGFPPLLTVFK